MNLDGPAREVIRSHGEVRCYYPDAKIVRVEPRTFRNVFPSLSPSSSRRSRSIYEFRIKAGRARRRARRRRRGVRAQGRPALRPPVLGRHGHRAAAQGAPGQREGRGGRAVRVHRHHDQRARSTGRWSSRRGRRRRPTGRCKQATVGRRRAARDRLDRRPACRPASSRSWKASARCAASGSRSRISYSPTGWSRSACSSSRSTAAPAADRHDTAGRRSTSTA